MSVQRYFLLHENFLSQRYVEEKRFLSTNSQFFFTGKFHSDLDTPVLNNPPDNDVDEDANDDLQTDGRILPSLMRTSTSSSREGFIPYWTNLNALNRLILKPSGNMIKMKCPAKGDPEPKWEWTKNGKKIERNLGTVAYNKMGITLEDLVPADNGEYTCNVCNKFGCISYTTKLEVNGEF